MVDGRYSNRLTGNKCPQPLLRSDIGQQWKSVESGGVRWQRWICWIQAEEGCLVQAVVFVNHHFTRPILNPIAPILEISSWYTPDKYSVIERDVGATFVQRQTSKYRIMKCLALKACMRRRDGGLNNLFDNNFHPKCHLSPRTILSMFRNDTTNEYKPQQPTITQSE
jgi:hypothetical protein